MAEPTICGVCGEELLGPWVKFHMAEPYVDTNGHRVDGSPCREERERLKVEKKQLDREKAARESGMAPPAPERAKLPKGVKPALEDDVMWAIIDYMRLVGYTVYSTEQGFRPGPGHTRVGVGMPDAYFQGHGMTGWIEGKRPDGPTDAKGKQTDEQGAFEKRELENGGIYLLVESVEQVVEWDRQQRGRQLELGA